VRSLVLLASLLLLQSIAMAAEPAEKANPAAVYCAKLGYSLSNGDCVFPDGTRCPAWHFYRGKCGQEWSYCAKRGGRFENRVEDRGSWTAEFGVCVFEVVSECSEQDLFDSSCSPGDCARWSSAVGCEPLPSLTPLLLASGSYDPGTLNVAVDTDSHTVTGFYENHTGWDERLKASRFSCEFFLEGTWDGNSARIQSWYPSSENRIGGVLTVPMHGQLEVTLDDEHGGCANVEPRFDEGGVSFKLRTARLGRAIAVIASEKAFFHDRPAEDQRGSPYVTRGDAIYVLESEPGWVRGSFRKTEGWLKASDLYTDTLPK